MQQYEHVCDDNLDSGRVGLAEAYTYDAYGNVKPWGYRVMDFNRDGDVDDHDLDEWWLCYGSVPPTDSMADGNLDGVIDGFDLSYLAAAATPDDEPPITLGTSAIGNPYFFTGRRLHFFETLHDGSPEGTDVNERVQYNRARHYDPKHGRWLQRDPIGYKGGGMNLYEYVRSRPTLFRDPTGRVFTIDSPIEALRNYVVGLGEPAELGGSLLGALTQYAFYNEILSKRIPDDMKRMLPSQCDVPSRTKTMRNGLAQVSTWTWWGYYNEDLNLAIGTINELDWKLTCTVAAGKPHPQTINGQRKCCCNKTARCDIRFFLDDVYTFDDWWNSPFRWMFGDALGGTNYSIHNEWQAPRQQVAVQSCN